VTSEKSAVPPLPEELPVVDDPLTSEKSEFGLSLENVMAHLDLIEAVCGRLAHQIGRMRAHGSPFVLFPELSSRAISPD
jgi:hypothetical protein